MSDSLAIATDRANDWPTAVHDLNQNGTAYPRNADEMHARLVRWFEESEQACSDGRRLAERDRSYVNGDQWTSEERKALKERGQPEISINYCRRKLDLLCGHERKARTDPKAFPRTPVEEDRADAATQALRYIADDNDFAVLRSQVFEEMLVEGLGGVEVSLEDDGQGGANIRLHHVRCDRIWYDPHSRQPDFLDARYKGIVIWMDEDQALEMYPDAKEVIDSSFSTNGGHGVTEFADKPDYLLWTDNQRQRCRVVQCHWSEGGEWWSATFTRAGYLAEPQRSMFKDRRGMSACPLILQSAYIDLENNRYGMVRDLISLQDEINKRRSKALHLLSVHQVIAEQGAVADVTKAQREVAKPDGYVEIMPGMKFEIAQTQQLAAGQFQLLQHATNEMQLSGPNAAMSGTDPRELSGRAILAQQAGGATQNEPLADSLRMWARRVYQMCWMAAREFWTAGKWVRVTDELQDTRWVGINRPITLRDELAKLPQEQMAMAMQQMQLVPGDPRLNQVLRIENDITDLDVDITVAEGQDVPALQAETFQTLVQLASMQPGLIPADVLIAASSLRDKEDLLARMKQHQEQQAGVQQKAGAMAERKAMADISQTEAKASADQALAMERRHNVVRGVHDMRGEFTAPPYGESFVAPPDNPPGAMPPPPSPDQHPDYVAARHLMDMAQRQATLRRTQAQTAAELAKTRHTNEKTRVDALGALVQANRLARTPIPQPGQNVP